MTGRDLEQLAVRVERLVHARRDGWDPADEMAFRAALPTGSAPLARRLPDPAVLRAIARGRGADLPAFAEDQRRAAVDLCAHLEWLARRNDPRNPQRILRDAMRGRLPR